MQQECTSSTLRFFLGDQCARAENVIAAATTNKVEKVIAAAGNNIADGQRRS